MENYIEIEKEIAEQSIKAIEQISEKAQEDLKNRSSIPYAAVNNTFTDIALIEKNQYRNIQTEQLLNITKNIPIIGRVLVEDENGKQECIYITKGYIVNVSGLMLTRETNPKGRLFAIDVGDECSINGHDYIVLEKNVYRTTKNEQEWDADTDFYLQDDFVDQISSLRQLLSKQEVDLYSFLNQTAPKKAGKLKRIAVNQLSLKENLMLDEYQDNIFRMEPNKAFVLMGPPGTGKTTTLIKKLGFNLETKYSDSEEQKSWYMFTPTKLLKEYLKEAFNRQSIAAPDTRLWVWDEYVLYLSRDIFPILETSVRKGLIFPKSFQEKKINYLKENTSSFQQHCYEVFYTWQDEYFLKNLYAKYKNILKSGTESVKEIFKSITDSDFKSFLDINLKINTISNKIEDKIKSLNDDLDNLVVKLVRETAIFKNKSFSEVNEYLGNLQKSVQTEMLSYKTDKDFDAVDDEDEDNENDDEKINTSSKDANHIFRNYVVASIKSLSRGYSQKKKLSHKSLYYLVGQYINFDNIIDDKHKQEIASYVIQIALLKNFNKLQNRYISGLVSRYKIYRKEYASFYVNDIDPKKITALELDILVLVFIKLIKLFKIEKEDLFRQQVFVDEITDFSTVQLSIMNNLLNDKSKTFFGAGDFNQRLTLEGVSSKDDLEWAIPKVEIEKITIPYRQSCQLTELSQLLIGKTLNEVKQPKYIDMEGKQPILGYNMVDINYMAKWLADRIIEIDRIMEGKLPSIAILVNSEEEIQPLANAMNNCLEDNNINVTPCFKGVVGSENGVRIFSIEYIKGLEFEAVFFINIDILAKEKPEIFDKYIYVGASRAATFLGLTCSSNQLPDKLQPMVHLFVNNWND